MACNWKRACGYLTVDGRDVGDLLISENLAHPYVCGALITHGTVQRPFGADGPVVRAVDRRMVQEEFHRISPPDARTSAFGHWASHQIDCSEFLSDRLGLVRDLGNRTGPTHIMLSFDRSQVDTIWPPRKRLEWRSPFKLSEPA
jgi:hypothetical protein